MQLDQPWQAARRRGMPPGTRLLVVQVPAQVMHLLEQGTVTATWPVSTARNGMNGVAESLGTPPGFHVIAERYGDGFPATSRFVSRRCVGPAPPEDETVDEDLILARILRLSGLEAGLNRGPDCDSYQRYIYLHGTNQLARIGHPVSRGCIRLAPTDMIDVFNRIAGAPAWCWIGDPDQ